MKISRVWAVYFSGTGTTEKTVTRIAASLAAQLNAEYAQYSFTLPQARCSAPAAAQDELVVCGVPVYAGRVPNLILPYIREMIRSNGALAVPVVLFGNRAFDDALLELRDTMEQNGFHTVAAAAFVGEHSFSRTLGAGRPDADDVAQMDAFSKAVAEKISMMETIPAPIIVRGREAGAYYQPKDENGAPINILKVKPLTDKQKCTNCGWCAAHCPMGSISAEDPSQVTGKCIKCCACEKGCPVGAKYFEDKGYLLHKRLLEENFSRRAEVELFT